MAFKWADYLAVATRLNAAGDEASQRAAVSRAYYAVFGEAKEAADTEREHDFSADSIHKSVINHFDGSSDSARKAFAANLKRLKIQRVRADYQRSRKVDARYAEEALHDADSLLNDLKNICSEDP